MGNNDSKSLPEERDTSNPDPTDSEDESAGVVFPDLKGASNALGQGNELPSRSKSRSPVKKSKQKLSALVKSFNEFLESCNAIPDYNSVATIEYARQFIHDGFSKCSGDDLSHCLAMLLEYFYKSFEKINMYRDIFYLIYKDSRYTHYTTRVFTVEFDRVFQQQKSKISENSNWGEVVMFGALLCELLTIYQADSFLVTKQLSNWSIELIKSALEGNDNGLIAYMLILKRLSRCKLPLKERFDHDLGVLKILLREENGESKTQEIYNHLEQRRLSQLADYECLKESNFSEEVANSSKCRKIEQFFESDNEKMSIDINLFFDITDNELEFFARKFIEVGIEKPQKIKFLAFTVSKFQNVLNSIRKIINLVVKHLEEEIEAMRQNKSKSGIPKINFAKFIAELYVNERKIISPIMMTSWLSLLTELGEDVAIVATLSICGYFYQIDEPENFDKFMDAITIFRSIVEEEMKEISDQLNGKGQEMYADYLKSRMYKPCPSAASVNDIDNFMFETSRSKNCNFDFQCLLEFRNYEMYNTSRAIINKVSRHNAKVTKLAEFLKSFFEFSFKIGKLVKRLKINFESRISEMTLDNLDEIKNVGKLIGELRNYTVIDKIPQDKWLEMMENFNGLKDSKVMEVQLEVLKIMFQNLLIHDEDRYMKYLKDVNAIDTSDPQITPRIKSLILQITRKTVPKNIDKTSKDILFRIKYGQKIDGFRLNIPASSQTDFDLNDFVKVFMVLAISNRFLQGFYTSSIKFLRDGRNNDFMRILKELCKDRFKNILNPELFDEDEAIGTLKLIRNLFKPSILTAENNQAFLQQMLDFQDFKSHTHCFKILFGMIKSVVLFTETRQQGASNKNLKALLRQVEAKLTGVDNSIEEVQEEVEIWHIVDYQGFTNEKSLLESETIESSQLAWSFSKNYQEHQQKEQKKAQKGTQVTDIKGLINQYPERSSNNNQRVNQGASTSSQNQRTKKRVDQNSFLYQNEERKGTNSMNNKNSRQGISDRAHNWRNNSQNGSQNRLKTSSAAAAINHSQQTQSSVRNVVKPTPNVGSDIPQNTAQKPSQNVQNFPQCAQKSNKGAQKEPNDTSIEGNRSNLGQSSKNDPKGNENSKQSTPNLGVSSTEVPTNVSQFKQTNRSAEKSPESTQRLNTTTAGASSSRESSNVQASSQKAQIAPPAAQNTKVDNPQLVNLNNLPPKPSPEAVLATYNEVMPLITSNTENFKQCAVFIHGWGLCNPTMQPAIKYLTALIKLELLLNHKQLLVDVAADLSNECFALGKKIDVQKKNLFVTAVKASVPFLERCAIYNMLDDLLGLINSGNPIALVLFLDLTEGIKEFLCESCRERDLFVPNCVKILQKATKFKGEAATGQRTFEMKKFFQEQKVNVASSWRNSSNSRLQRAGSTQSVSITNNSRRNSRGRRVNWNQNNQAAGGNGGRKVGSTQKSGNASSNDGSTTSKPGSGQKSRNITLKNGSITLNTNSEQNRGNITAKVDSITSKTDTNASTSQKFIADFQENLKIDEKIKFYINQLDESNAAVIGLKITELCNKESTKQHVLDALLEKGVSDKKFIQPVVKLFEFLFKTSNFEALKASMADMIGNEFIYACEKKNKLQQVLSNFAKFTKAFEPFITNSLIFDLWWELLEFVRCDTPNVLGNLVFLMSDRLDLFYATEVGRQSIQEFVRVFKMKLKLVKDKNLKAKIETIIRSLESGQSEKKRNGNEAGPSHRPVEKVAESSAEKTKNLVKLLGVGSDGGDSDLFNQIKTQIQSGELSQADQTGNICTKLGAESDKNDPKDNKSDQMTATKDPTNDNYKQKTDNLVQHFAGTHQTKDEARAQNRALIEIQQKLERIYLQNPTAEVLHPEKVQIAHSVANKQAKLIQGLTKQLGLLDIENEAPKAEKIATIEPVARTNQDQVLESDQVRIGPEKADQTDETSSSKQRNTGLQDKPWQTLQSESPTSDPTPALIKKSISTHRHPDDRIRPMMFTSDYILFDKSVENRRKFAEILKIMCSVVSNQCKDSIEVRENIAKALIKLNYLKLRADSDEFYDFAEVFFQLYSKPEISSFNRFVMLKFLKAWKFYEENVEQEGGKIYDRFSKSVCRIKKSFRVSSEEPMEGNLAAGESNITYKSGGVGTGAVPNMTSITLNLSDITSKSYFTTFSLCLMEMLTNLMTGHATIKQEYIEEAIQARRPGICQLICDLYLHGVASSDFVIKTISELLKSHPDNSEFIAEILKNVGALLEVREKEKLDKIFPTIFSKIQENPGKVTEIFELRKNRYTNVENFTPIFLLFHENPGKFFGFIKTLWKRLMENPGKVAELSEIVEELLENLGEKFASLISEFMENRRISFKKIPTEMFSKIVSQRLKGSILFSFELFEMQVMSSERFAGWLKDEVYGKLGNEEKFEISGKLLKCGIEVGEALTETLEEQIERFNKF